MIGGNIHAMSHTFQIAWLMAGVIVGAGCQPDAASPRSRSGCRTRTDTNTDSESTASDSSVLRLASTTSTRDSGLCDVLLPMFEQLHNCRVDLIAVGTGKALRLAEAGDVDVILCHAKSAEEAFVAAGHGVRREPVMHNSFLIVGPADDPAAIQGIEPAEAIGKIGAGQHRFVSRGDDSGTHQREMELWDSVGGHPTWQDYIETGQGMGPTLIIADEMDAYLLVDMGTWLKRRDGLRLAELITEGQGLENPYAVTVVNPVKHPAIHDELAHAFADFLVSDQAQTVIADYRVNGTRLFHPDRLAQEQIE